MESRINQAPPIYRVKKKKNVKWKWLWIVLGVLVLCYLALFLLVTPARPAVPVFQGDAPLVIAHRGGAALAPENTLVAFDKARSLGVDMIEFDVRMTKDGHLIVIHDDTLDRTTNGKGEVSELTLAEIKEYDAAYRFSDVRKRYIYRGQGVKVPTVEEVFQKFGDTRMSIEIKEPLKDKEDPDIEQKLWSLIEQYQMQDKVVISSFSDQILARFLEHSGGKVAMSASKQELQSFVFYHKLFLNRLYRPNTDAFQLPSTHGIFSLDDKRLINGAKRLNMAIIYWTINEEEEMRKLLERGASGIITDRPDLLIRVIKEMEDRHETN